MRFHSFGFLFYKPVIQCADGEVFKKNVDFLGLERFAQSDVEVRSSCNSF
jgi:hypothetical protein